ncbi:uncharacterized protein LOC125235531 [Leguminivora glycinivorella]|uniref:uncharacterized protein LOC125225170 n=1 Tax=Leguminivora glycinivorella TaxID=1035111 RepID=UPI00200D2A79|nr:uncharacterized protein LOC125225170 [Leguminivora glycinivorella]XP_047990854.1 uncharacterized protein LOC125229948 [Leguminivora glycinivorella]XP_047998074.1 uncharacterized protein LOC125235531 [Leguminivora glycinivorella]
MPKRSAEEKIAHYTRKIQRIQEKKLKRIQQVSTVLPNSSDSEEKSDHEDASAFENVNEEPEGSAANSNEETPPPPQTEAGDAETVPVIDAELLTALGEATDEAPKYGEQIHPDLAQRWLPILRKGMDKNAKDELIKEYSIPENCKLLRAPSLNAEISAAVTDIARGRDKKIEAEQQLLGVGLSAINRAMTLLLTTDDKQSKVRAIKTLSDGCRILSDLHFLQSQARVKLVTPGLDKVFLNLIQDVERDEALFGSKLSEKIKASKAIEKQSSQIKKTVATPATSTFQAAGPSYARYRGNWSRPARFQPTSRRGRGGPRWSAPAAPRSTAPASAQTQPKAAYTRPRAPARQ